MNSETLKSISAYSSCIPLDVSSWSGRDGSLRTDELVSVRLPEKRLIGEQGSICNTQLALKKPSPAGPVLSLLDNI